MTKPADKQQLPSSFRDPAGFVFEADGQVLRQVNKAYLPMYRHLMDSGLYAKLVSEKLLVEHEELDPEQGLTEEAALVLRPVQLPFISYPYEWCFGQLQQAALALLRVQLLALEHGLILKDGSAYNLQWQQGQPVLIDTLSFAFYRPGQAWDGYGQFCRHFLAPLALMHYTDVRLSQLLRVHLDGIPLDLAASLLPFKSKLSFGIFSHLHLHASGQKRYAGKAVKPQGKGISLFQLKALTDSLQSAVQGLQWQASGTEWGDYYQHTNYSATATDSKRNTLAQWLQQLKPRTVWDLGANDGTYSRLASATGAFTVAFDIDPAAVELNYRKVREHKEHSLLPLLLDLTNPSPAIGWALQERQSVPERGPCEVALALALVHHLAIGNNLPLPLIASFLQRLCRHLLIEFVPREDSQVQRLLASREDIFTEYHRQSFEQAFSQYFVLDEAVPVADSERVLYRMRVKTETE